MKYAEESNAMMGNTDGAIAKIAQLGITVESGVGKIIEESDPTTYYTIMNTATQSGSDSSYLFVGSPSTSAYPSDWSSNDTVYWK